MIKTAEMDDIANVAYDGKGILASDLHGYKAEENDWGEAMTFPGGFCLSVKMVKPGYPDKCLRCWHSPDINNIPNFLSYIRNIATEIDKRRSYLGKYFVNFKVIDEIADIPGTGKIPGIIMDWIKGETLGQYVTQDSEHNSRDIMNIANQFKTLCSDMIKYGIAHGDLSSSNIMVLPNSYSLQLIDYDSMYFKNSPRMVEVIKGVAYYRHPGRINHTYAELYSDYFSQHIIYTALIIFSKNPGLRPKFEDKFLYFQEEDLKSAAAFNSSKRVRQARNINDSEKNSELDIIGKALAGRYEDVPPLIRPIDKGATNPPQEEKKKPILYQVRYCTNCGHVFDDSQNGFKFCTVCGAKRYTFYA